MAVANYPRASSRAMDLGAMRGHLIRVMNDMMTHIGDPPTGNYAPDVTATFILAGYSWLTTSFKIWTIYYDQMRQSFRYRSPTPWRNQKTFVFEGDSAKRARRALFLKLREAGKGPDHGLDMEPFAVIRDMCTDDNEPHIGGPPQVLKVYRHMNTMPYAVPWKINGQERLTVLGRPLLDYERTYYLVLDPATMATSVPRHPARPETGEQAASA